MIQQFYYNSKWYIAVPIDTLPPEVALPDPSDLAEPIDDVEARIVKSLTLWLWRKTKQNNPHRLHLKDSQPPSKRKKRDKRDYVQPVEEANP